MDKLTPELIEKYRSASGRHLEPGDVNKARGYSGGLWFRYTRKWCASGHFRVHPNCRCNPPWDHVRYWRDGTDSVITAEPYPEWGSQSLAFAEKHQMIAEPRGAGPYGFGSELWVWTRQHRGR